MKKTVFDCTMDTAKKPVFCNTENIMKNTVFDFTKETAKKTVFYCTKDNIYEKDCL